MKRLPSATMWGSLTMTLTLTLVVSPVTSVIKYEEPITCLDGEMRCRRDTHCTSLLDNLPQVCDPSGDTCYSSRYELCFNILSTLQRSAQFRGCLCDDDDVECNNLRRIIYHHACLYKVLSQNSSYSLPSPSKSVQRTREDPPPVTERDDDVISYSARKSESCIFLRKRCLRTHDCAKRLEQFWDYCRENKKQHLCVATRREECFRAIMYLQGSGIFNCRCDLIEKDEPKTKCDRIQYRVANNTCLVEVPYFIYTVGLYDGGGEPGVLPIADHAAGSEINSGAHYESTCIDAFEECQLDRFCRERMADFQDACEWNQHTSTCDKNACLQALQNYVTFVRPNITQAQRFCRCFPDDVSCMQAKRKLSPVCSVVDYPAPTCLRIMDSCLSDKDCSIRLKEYEKYCGYHKKEGPCPSGPARCRKAMMGIMGTVLTTNCTCVMADPGSRQLCEEARDRIQRQNLCKRMAIADFHEKRREELTRRGENQISHHNTLHVHATSNRRRHDCLQQMLPRFRPPSFMNLPEVMRVYHNNSHDQCSQLCQCEDNGTLICRTLPCNPNYVCKFEGQIHDHGTNYATESNEGGSVCRCIRGETVCAKPAGRGLSQAGLFFHIGYSLSDMFLVEGSPSVVFSPDSVAEKLGAILNEDSAEQFCSFSLFARLDGNLIFRVAVSPSSPSTEGNKDCNQRATQLKDKINSRNQIIVRDAELSVLKIAELENISIHKPPRGEELFVGSRTDSGSHGRSRDYYSFLFNLVSTSLVLVSVR